MGAMRKATAFSTAFLLVASAVSAGAGEVSGLVPLTPNGSKISLEPLTPRGHLLRLAVDPNAREKRTEVALAEGPAAEPFEEGSLPKLLVPGRRQVAAAENKSKLRVESQPADILQKSDRGRSSITSLPKERVAEADAAATAQVPAAPKAAAPNDAHPQLPEFDARYQLVTVEGGLARLDMESGSFDICRDPGSGWRCLPVPQARQAYEAEIARLNDEVEELKAKISARENLPEKGGAESVAPTMPDAPGDGNDETRFSPEDEENLDRVMQFSEKAMRRFFGMMKDMQEEFGSE